MQKWSGRWQSVGIISPHTHGGPPTHTRESTYSTHGGPPTHTRESTYSTHGGPPTQHMGVHLPTQGSPHTQHMGVHLPTQGSPPTQHMGVHLLNTWGSTYPHKGVHLLNTWGSTSTKRKCVHCCQDVLWHHCSCWQRGPRSWAEVNRQELHLDLNITISRGTIAESWSTEATRLQELLKVYISNLQCNLKQVIDW
jgi:hypothetical protein